MCTLPILAQEWSIIELLKWGELEMSEPVRILNENDAADYFNRVCEREIGNETSRSENSYGFLNMPKRKNPGARSPGDQIVQETKGMEYLLDLSPNLDDNLRWSSTKSVWEDFYCFPSNAQVKALADKEGVDTSYIANASDKNSKLFRDRLLDSVRRAVPNSTTNLIFLEGTTGVGKTTFVKYHTKMEKENYLEQRAIVTRVQFRRLEKLIENSQNAAEEYNALTYLELFEKLILNCMFRDLIDSYKITKSDKSSFPTGAKAKDLETSITDVEARLDLQQELNPTDTLILERVPELSEGDLERLGDEIKLSALELACEKNFHFILFFDGFDAIEPESIKLDDADESAIFLKCLESIAKGSFSGSGPIFQFLRTQPLLFVICARQITMAQLVLSVQREVDLKQIFEQTEYVAPSDIYSIFRKRLGVRSSESTDYKFNNLDLLLYEEAFSRCLRELAKAYDIKIPGGFVKIFNHNIREKIAFLNSLSRIFLRRLSAYIYNERSVRMRLRARPEQIINFVRNISLHKLSLDTYELEKILFLGEDERFTNYFVYDLSHDTLVTAKYRGAFDNIFNYRTIDPTITKNQPAVAACPLLVKVELMRKIGDEPGIQTPDLFAWADEYLGCVWDKKDLKMLIRAGFVFGSYPDKMLCFELTDKGQFAIAKLLNSYSYFERACTAAALPKHVRSRMTSPKETSGAEWGSRSIVNVGVFISYLKSLESQQKLPSNHKIGDKLPRIFHESVIRSAKQGIDGPYDYYLQEISTAIKKAL